MLEIIWLLLPTHSRVSVGVRSLFFYHFLYLFANPEAIETGHESNSVRQEEKRKKMRPDGQTTHISAINKHDSVVAVNLLAIFRDERWAFGGAVRRGARARTMWWFISTENIRAIRQFGISGDCSKWIEAVNFDHTCSKKNKIKESHIKNWDSMHRSAKIGGQR